MSERMKGVLSVGRAVWARVLRRAVLAMAVFGAAVSPAVLAQQAASADAASTGPVRVELTQMRVDTEAGKEKLVAFESVKPGEVVEYRAVYTNTSKSAIKDLVASLPIPDGLDYIARSARGSQGLSAPQVVLRDGRAGAEPLVVVADGKKVEVPAAEYRSLRWRVGSLAAGKSVSVSARAMVSMFPIDAEAAPSSAGSSVVPQR